MSIFLNLILLLSCIAVALAGPLPRNLDVSTGGVESSSGSVTSDPTAYTTTASIFAPSFANALTNGPAATSAPALAPSVSSSSVTLVTKASTTITARLNPPAFTMGVPSWFSSVETSLNHETSTKRSDQPSVSFSFSYDPSASDPESTYSAPQTATKAPPSIVRSVSTTTLTLYTTVFPEELPTTEAGSAQATATATPSPSGTEASSAQATAIPPGYTAQNGTDFPPTKTGYATGHSPSTRTRASSESDMATSVPTSDPAQKDASATTPPNPTNILWPSAVAESTTPDVLPASTTSDVTTPSQTSIAKTSSPTTTTAFSFAHPPPNPPSPSTTSTEEAAQPSSSPVVHTKTELPKVPSISSIASSTRVESHPTQVVPSTSSPPAGITIIPINPNFITVTVTKIDAGVTTTVTAP